MSVCSHFGDHRSPEPGKCPCDPSCLCRANKEGSCYKQNFDPVQRPAHYNTGKVECIDAIEAAAEGLFGFEAFCTGQVIKYIWRWKKKAGLEDLKKCRWYLDRLIQRVEGAPK